MAPPSNSLSSLDRGLQILSFTQDQGEVTVAKITQELGIPSSTAYRYVNALIRRGFLFEVNGRLIASNRLADATTNRFEQLKRVARPTMEWLYRETGLSVVLTVRVHTAVMCLDTLRASNVRLFFRVGQAVSMNSGASASPLFATAPASVTNRLLDSRLPRFTADTPDAHQMVLELKKIIDSGYAVSSGWSTPGVTAIGVPVMAGTKCLCALSLIGNDSAINDISPLVDILKDAATRVYRAIANEEEAGWAHLMSQSVEATEEVFHDDITPDD